jgi:hypothetical protein
MGIGSAGTGAAGREGSTTNQASGGGSGSVPEAFSQVGSIRTRAAGIFDAEISGEWTIAGKPYLHRFGSASGCFLVSRVTRCFTV